MSDVAIDKLYDCLHLKLYVRLTGPERRKQRQCSWVAGAWTVESSGSGEVHSGREIDGGS